MHALFPASIVLLVLVFLVVDAIVSVVDGEAVEEDRGDGSHFRLD